MPYRPAQMQQSNKPNFVTIWKMYLPWQMTYTTHNHDSAAFNVSVLFALKSYRAVLMSLSGWLLSGVKLPLLGRGSKSVLLCCISEFLFCSSEAAAAEVISKREEVRLQSSNSLCKFAQSPRDLAYAGQEFKSLYSDFGKSLIQVLCILFHSICVIRLALWWNWQLNCRF